MSGDWVHGDGATTLLVGVEGAPGSIRRMMGLAKEHGSLGRSEPIWHDVSQFPGTGCLVARRRVRDGRSRPLFEIDALFERVLRDPSENPVINGWTTLSMPPTDCSAVPTALAWGVNGSAMPDGGYHRIHGPGPSLSNEMLDVGWMGIIEDGALEWGRDPSPPSL